MRCPKAAGQIVISLEQGIRTERPDHGRYLQFQPRVHSKERVGNQNAQPVDQSKDTADDLDRDKLSQLVYWILDLRNPDYCEPTPGRAKRSLRRRLLCRVRGRRRNFSGGSLLCRCLFPLEILRGYGMEIGQCWREKGARLKDFSLMYK
jgi:hypothetical protein